MARVLKTLQVGPDATVVLYDWIEVANANLILLRPDGDVGWQSDPRKLGYSPNDCFVDVRQEGAEIRANTWSGWLVSIDIADGAVTPVAFTK